MDLSRLLATFPPDRDPLEPLSSNGDLWACVDALGGLTFASGLYRVFPRQSIQHWTSVARANFPQFGSRITVFGADWLGRFLASDSGRLNANGEHLVLLLEPATSEAFEVPATVVQVHTSELVDDPDALAAEPFYREWRMTSGDTEPLGLDECVGYRVPLVLGGGDVVTNLERTDLAVYWSFSSQIHEQTVGLPEGSRVVAVSEERARRGFFGRRR